jgi:hydroxyacylglutathione hydrolase
MQLEDHAGDILRKARQAADVPLEIVAQAAGLRVQEYTDFEETGLSNWPPNFGVLGPLLGLHSTKLGQIAQGWLPAMVDSRRWSELRPVSTSHSGNKVNSYLVWDPLAHEAALFDTGWEADPVFRILTDNQLDLKHVFLTHHHGDHVAALGSLQKKYPRAQIHSNDHLSPPDLRNHPDEVICLGSLQIANRPTPGHSEDGVTYLVSEFPGKPPLVAVVGDALFAGSMGRGFQSTALLKESVQTQILSLPGATLLCPGHGPYTTVAEELEHNPFF